MPINSPPPPPPTERRGGDIGGGKMGKKETERRKAAERQKEIERQRSGNSTEELPSLLPKEDPSETDIVITTFRWVENKVGSMLSCHEKRCR